MHSRQFSFLVLAIFISTVSFGQSVVNDTASASAVKPEPLFNVSSDLTTPVPTTPDAHGSVSGSASTTTPVSSTESSTTTHANPEPTMQVPVTNGPVTSTAAESTTSSTSMPTTSSTTSAKPTVVTNDHSIRDVSDKCAEAYNATDKGSWSPEKVILAVSVTVDQFCKNLDNIKRLNALCNNKTGLDSDDKKVAPVVAGLTEMFSTICSNPKAAFNVTVGDSTACVESIKSITKKCSANSLSRAIHVFPTEELFEEMVKENCTVVFKTKGCIIEEIEKSDVCSVAQASAITQAIIMVTKTLPCNLPFSSETTPSPAAAPTTTAPKPTPTKTPSQNSATSFQVNFFTVLPVLLLAFKFY